MYFKIQYHSFSESPNVFDSYGEALKINGDLKAALESYQKAVDIAMQKTMIRILLITKRLFKRLKMK
jgi:hypothetical protein